MPLALARARPGALRVALPAFFALFTFTSVAWACLNDDSVATREGQFRSSYASARAPAPPPRDRLAWALALVGATGLVATVLADRVLAHRRVPSERSLLQRRLARRHAIAIALAVVAPPAVAIFAVPRAWLRLVERWPAPHHAAALPGGTSLRLAMLHDLVTDRYERPSPAWHEARVAKRLAAVEAAERRGAPLDPGALDAMDDAAVSLDQLHRQPEGIALMRRKLALLGVRAPNPEAASAVVRDLFGDSEAKRHARMASPLAERDRPRYRAAANLATLLAHQALAKGSSCAIARENEPEPLEEARRWLLDAIAIHPGAHFGREMWQLAALDWIRLAACRPDSLVKYDLLGDDLARPVPALARLHEPELHRCMRGLNPARIDAGELSDSERACLRSHIPGAGAEAGFRGWGVMGDDDADRWPRAFLSQPVPFDEPALALFGMWVFGGGPNPHSALALAQLAEHAGEGHLAVEGYLRAWAMADRFSADPAMRAWLAAYCERRVGELARRLAQGEPGLTVAELRRRFELELAAGRAFQAARDADETARLAAGADVDDPALAAALAKAHGSIATAPGSEEWVVIERAGGADVLALACLATSIGAPLVLAMLEWLRSVRDRRRPLEPLTYRA